MLIPVIVAAVGFLVGLVLVGGYAPDLAATRSGRTAGRLVDILGGAAVATFALSVERAVHLATTDYELDWPERAVALGVADRLASGMWQAGLLLAAAAAVQLMAPQREDV